MSGASPIKRLVNWVADSGLAPVLHPLYLAFASGRSAAYDRETRAVLRRVLSSRSNAVDIGAHRGTVLRQIVKCAPGGSHYAFEPVPEYAARLRTRFPNAHVEEVALGATKGTETFIHVVGDPGLSGFRPHRRAQERSPKPIVVRVERLDDVLPGDYVAALIKLDVEGAEHLVVRGAAGSIRRARPVIIFECGISAAERYAEFTPELMHGLITSLGLRISLMRRWLDSQPPLSEAEFGRILRDRSEFYFIAYP